MVTKIVTDYFTWGVFSWSVLFLLTVIILGIIQFLIIKNTSNGLIYKESIVDKVIIDSDLNEEKSFLYILHNNCIDIWFNNPSSDLIAILMLFFFFVVAIFFR